MSVKRHELQRPSVSVADRLPHLLHVICGSSPFAESFCLEDFNKRMSFDTSIPIIQLVSNRYFSIVKESSIPTVFISSSVPIQGSISSIEVHAQSRFAFDTKD